MSAVVDLIRRAEAPAAVMRAAARGALSVTTAERLEILVHLAQSQDWQEIAEATLRDFDEDTARQVLCSFEAPIAVLRYFLEPGRLRSEFLPDLLANPAVPLAAIARLAQQADTNTAALLLNHVRVQSSPEVLAALASNQHLSTVDAERLQGLTEQTFTVTEADPYSSSSVEHDEFQRKYAQEIAAAAGLPFSLTDAGQEELDQLETSAEAGKLTVLQKIASLKVGERIKLAMLGARDERFILIRDTNKIVAQAVLQSPKLSEVEMECYACMKNVQEDVLRSIARNRKFMKNYSVVRSLVNNPRTPLEIAMPLVSHLTSLDLRQLARNKNVSETLRKLAMKIVRAKTTDRR